MDSSSTLVRVQAVLLLLVATGLPAVTDAHGVLVKPMGRNMYRFYNQKPATFWEPQGLNGGGPKAVSQGGTRKWPTGLANLCGGAWNKPDWMAPTPIQGRYKAGGQIDVHTILYNNHGAQFRVTVCPRGATTESQCVKLNSVVTKKPYFILPLPKCGCVDASDGRDSGYPAIVDGFKVYNYVSQDQFKGYPVLVIQWQLPARLPFSCAGGCILRWHWITSSTCQPPCVLGRDKYCRTGQVMCGAAGAYYPEEFWNCADVVIA